MSIPYCIQSASVAEIGVYFKTIPCLIVESWTTEPLSTVAIPNICMTLGR